MNLRHAHILTITSGVKFSLPGIPCLKVDILKLKIENFVYPVFFLFFDLIQFFTFAVLVGGDKTKN